MRGGNLPLMQDRRTARGATRRSRRRAFAWTASAGVHLFAFAVLTPVVTPHIRTRLATRDDTAIQVQIIRLRDGLGRTTPKTPDKLEALKPNAPGDPQPPPPPPVLPPTPEDADADPSVVAQDSPVDLEPLFRAPFRDAAGQAAAALRGGLGCDHVDLAQLPAALLDACAAVGRGQAAKSSPPQTESPSAQDRGADLKT
jgi:hypothetical protein